LPNLAGDFLTISGTVYAPDFDPADVLIGSGGHSGSADQVWASRRKKRRFSALHLAGQVRTDAAGGMRLPPQIEDGFCLSTLIITRYQGNCPASVKLRC
jgi:hypothetical protein